MSIGIVCTSGCESERLPGSDPDQRSGREARTVATASILIHPNSRVNRTCPLAFDYPLRHVEGTSRTIRLERLLHKRIRNVR